MLRQSSGQCAPALQTAGSEGFGGAGEGRTVVWHWRASAWWIFCAHQVPDPTATMVQLMYGSTRSSSLACKFMQVAGGYWLLTAPPNTHCSNHAAPPIAERNNTGMHTQTRLKGLAVQPDLTETGWSPRISCHLTGTYLTGFDGGAEPPVRFDVLSPPGPL